MTSVKYLNHPVKENITINNIADVFPGLQTNEIGILKFENPNGLKLPKLAYSNDFIIPPLKDFPLFLNKVDSYPEYSKYLSIVSSFTDSTSFKTRKISDDFDVTRTVMKSTDSGIDRTEETKANNLIESKWTKLKNSTDSGIDRTEETKANNLIESKWTKLKKSTFKDYTWIDLLDLPYHELPFSPADNLYIDSNRDSIKDQMVKDRKYFMDSFPYKKEKLQPHYHRDIFDSVVTESLELIDLQSTRLDKYIHFLKVSDHSELVKGIFELRPWLYSKYKQIIDDLLDHSDVYYEPIPRYHMKNTTSSNLDFLFSSNVSDHISEFQDVLNFYYTFTTHSIPWALVGQSEARANKDNHAAYYNLMDKLIRDCQLRLSRGIPVGFEILDHVIELFLRILDVQVIKKTLDSDRPLIRYKRYLDKIHFVRPNDNHYNKLLQETFWQYKLEFNKSKELIGIQSNITDTVLQEFHNKRLGVFLNDSIQSIFTSGGTFPEELVRRASINKQHEYLELIKKASLVRDMYSDFCLNWLLLEIDDYDASVLDDIWKQYPEHIPTLCCILDAKVINNEPERKRIHEKYEFCLEQGLKNHQHEKSIQRVCIVGLCKRLKMEISDAVKSSILLSPDPFTRKVLQ